MDQVQAVRREKRKTFLVSIAAASAVMLIGAPIVQAATQAVRVKGPVKIKDSTGLPIESEAIDALGVLDAEGSSGAVAVRTFAGGGGLLGTGDCTEAVGPQADGSFSRPNTVTVPAGEDTIITGIIVTGEDAHVSVSAPDLASVIGPGPVNTFSTTPQNQSLFIGLGNGLTVSPAKLVFECGGAGGTGDGSGNFTILGQ